MSERVTVKSMDRGRRK